MEQEIENKPAEEPEPLSFLKPKKKQQEKATWIKHKTTNLTTKTSFSVLEEEMV